MRSRREKLLHWSPLPLSRTVVLEVFSQLIELMEENCERCDTNNPQNQKKKKRIKVLFAAQGHFCSPLLKLHPLYDLQTSLFYLESHLDQNSNIALLTNATKPALFSGSISNFCLVTGRPQMDMMTISDMIFNIGLPILATLVFQGYYPVLQWYTGIM